MYQSPYVLALGVSVVVATGFGALTWRRRPKPGTAALSVLLASAVFWAGLYAVALSIQDRSLRLLFQQLLWIGSATAPVAWLVFSLQYTGYGDSVTREAVGLLSIVPVATVLLSWTNDWHALVWTDSTVVVTDGLAVVTQVFGPVLWVFVAYAYTLVLAGIVLMLRLVFTADHLFADQALALLIGALVPLVANGISLAGLAPIQGLDLTPYAFSISGITFGYALYQSELLERVPATRRIGRNAVVQNMRDGVIVLDDDDVIVDVNPIAENQFSCNADAVIGHTVEEVICDPDIELPEEEETFVWSGAGPLEYEIKVSRLTDQHDRLIGQALVVRDITDRTNRQQQLQVLNRVLRHNFRNDMNVIDVCATQLADRLDDENAELAARIRMVARDLTETGTKAREIERIMSRHHNDPQPIDLPSLVKRQVDTLRHEYSEIDIRTSLPDTLEIRSTGVLESVLQNVLENAVIHNDHHDPWVQVDVEEYPTANTIEVQITDNGPGIPTQERDVLVKGTESPLEHGSGLGLWLVNWGVSMLGGDIEFEDRGDQSTDDERGSVVTISIPHQQSTPPEWATDESPIDAS